MRSQARTVVAMAFALAVAIIVPDTAAPAPANAEQVLGGQLYSTGGTIQIEVLPASAGLTSQLYLLEPEPEVFIATNREVGKVVELGPFESGVELIFGIRVRGNEFRTGPAERNPDGIVHASVDFIEEGVAMVGFEDLFGGGDRDYNDNVFRFTGNLAPEPSPDPDPDPDPVPGAEPPIAAAGPDQSVPEGSTVQLDASGSTDPGAFGLVPSEEAGNLPGGTALTATLSELNTATGTTQTLSGSVAVGEGVASADTALVYVLDVSGSTLSGGGCGGDFNGDGRTDNILDCEAAASAALNVQAIESETVGDSGIVVFASSANTGDVSPEADLQTLAAPAADEDDDGTPDIEQVLRSVFSRNFGGSVGLNEFTRRTVGNTSTNFSAGIQTACDLAANSALPNRIVVFLSDGANNSGANVATVLPCSTDTTYYSFAAGPGVSCASNPSRGGLQQIADLTGGTCTDVENLDDLPDILSAVVSSRILSASITVDDGDPVDISDQVVPPLPTDGPATADFAVEIPALGPGIHEVCLTVTGSDQGGESSVTTCSPVTDVEGELSYRWELVSYVGPPTVLSSATAEMPTFLAIDDGTYTFELEVLSVTGLTDTDHVTVTVTNVDPAVSADSREAFAGGVTLVTASLTDEGWLDVHDATIDWGDGSGPVPVTVSANGAGWGTVFGSHIYDDAGTYDVVVTVTDDDGATASDTIDTLTVAEPVAVWANGRDDKKTLDWNGGSGTIQGRVHSNNELRITGDTKTILGSVEYVNKLTLSGDHIIDPPPVQVAVSDYPISFTVADFAPGGPVAIQVGDRYFDRTASCVGGEWHLTQEEVLGDGVYYVPCEVHLNGSNIGGRITLVATGAIQVNGSRPAFEPYYDGLLLLSGATGKQAIDVAASNSKFLGVVFAGTGEVSLSGSGNRFYCGILGDMVDMAGSGLDVRGAACGRPSSTVADPVVVPELSLLLEADRDAALPGDGIGYDLTVTNDGALLVVPGVVGLENVDDIAATVQSYAYQLEYFSIADGAWVPMASATGVADGYTPVDPLPTIGGTDVAFQQNPFTGVSYPAGGDAIVGTVIDPAGLATWGYQALVELDPAQVDMLLDPAVVGGVRNRIDFELAPGATQVRRLFRFGTDFIDRLRALSGDITDVQITQTLPVGDPAFRDATTDPALALLAPGESATLNDAVTVPPVPARTDGESDSAYLSRLLAADGDALASAAYARGVGGVGMLVAPQMFVVTTEQVPVVAVDKTGPGAADAGALVAWDVQLNNLGSTPAGALAITDELDGEPLALTGAPVSLAPNEVAVLRAEYVIPADSDGTPLANRAEATWEDAGGNVYGPLGSTVVTDVATAADVSATLVDSLQVDADGNGLVSPGDTIRYTAVVTNGGDQAISGTTLTAPVDVNSSVVAGSVTTTAGAVISETPVTIDIGVLAGNSAATITWDVAITDPFPEGGNTISTQGTIVSVELADLLTDDPAQLGLDDPTVTIVSLPIPVLYANLSGVLAGDADGNGVPSAGDTIRYTSEITNAGGGDATTVLAAFDSDANTDLVVGSVTTSAGTVAAGNGAGDTMVQVDLGTMTPSSTATVTFDVTIDDPFPSGVDVVVLQGIITSSELQPVATDDPSTSAEGDPTSIPVFGTGGGGPGGGGGPAPTFDEVTPTEGEVVTAPVPVTGTITPPDGETIESWQVIAYPAGGDPGDGLIAGSGSGAPPTLLAEFDPTLVGNGVWTIRVEAVSSGGGTSFTETSVVVEGQLKLGRFTTTFQDLSFGISGFDVQVLRTYDSLERFASSDFGHGWSVEIADFRVATNGPLGEGGWTMFQCGGGLIFVPLCFDTATPHFVSVTWPDGLVETFDLTPAQGSTFFPGLTQAAFTGRPGTTSTLAGPDNSLFFTGDGNLYGGPFGSGGIYDPDLFVLTDSAGIKYTLGTGVGLVQVEDRNGNTLTFSEDGIQSSAGTGLDFVRDPQGRITRATGPDGAAVAYTYAPTGDLDTVTDPNGDVAELTYIADHLLSGWGAAGVPPIQTITYDADGRIDTISDGEGNTVAVDVDPTARTETYVGPDPRLTTIRVFDDRGNIASVSEIFDGRTLTYLYEYDEFDRRTVATGPTGGRSTVEYGPKGEIVHHIDADGVTTDIDYDEYGFPTIVTVDGAVQERYEYDASGNTTAIEYADGSRLAFGYDSSGRLTSSTDTADRTTSYTYDADGFVDSITSPLGTTTFVNDEAGRTIATTTPDGATTQYEYDGVGNLTAVIDPLGHRTDVTYDEFYRITSVTDPLGDVRSLSYDAAGRLESFVDRNGVTTTFVHNPYGEPLQRTTSDGSSTTYIYDAVGQLLSAENATATITLGWDDAGNLRSETVAPVGAPSQGVMLEYDVSPAGRLLSVTDPFGTTTLGYGDRGVLDTVTDSVVGQFAFDVDATGRVESVSRPNGITTTAVYDDDRLASLNTPGVVSRTFEYDSSGLPQVITDDDGAHVMSYDSAGRLVGVDHPDASGYVDESFTYDDAGNRTSWAGTPLGSTNYDDANRLLGDGVAEYTYDDEGRLLTRTDTATGVVTTYVWDAAGRLTAVDASDGTTASFGYDPFGRRVAETVNGNERWVTFDGLNERLVWDGSGQLDARLVQAPQLGSVLSRTDTTGTVFPVLDEAGTVVALTDTAGSAVGRYRYSAFGEPIGATAPDGVDLWQGMPGSDLGLALSWARAYDPSTGRFLSEDPVPALNAYAYALNNPITTSDSTGLAAAAEYGTNTSQSAKSAPAICTQGSLTAAFFAEFAADFVFEAALSAVVPNGPGLYGFIDQTRGNRWYIGRSVDLRARILQHLRDARPKPGTRGFIIRLADEAVDQIDVAEQLLINSCGTVGKAGTLANRINAVNAKRREQLAELGTTLISLLGG